VVDALFRARHRVVSIDNSTGKGLAMLQQAAERKESGSCVAGCGQGRTARVVTWAAQVVVAVVLAQTLFFKFSYAPETQVIFADRGGRAAATVVGLLELVCVVLLLVPRTAALGALLALVTISGALFTHLTSLGISIPIAPGSEETDGGTLFVLALLVAAGSLVVLGVRRRQLPLVGPASGRRSSTGPQPTAPAAGTVPAPRHC
jgi:hypothetical protein